MKHFLDINKTNLDDLNRILEQAKKTKITRTGFSNGAPDQNQALSGKMVALIFEKPVRVIFVFLACSNIAFKSSRFVLFISKKCFIKMPLT